MTSETPPPRRTPQEKKALSLLKDRRNTYGNSEKAARKIIPLRKAKAIRSNRHKNNQALANLGDLTEAAADLVESSASQDTNSVKRWRKSPDSPLGEALALKIEGRAGRDGRKVRVRAARKAVDTPS